MGSVVAPAVVAAAGPARAPARARARSAEVGLAELAGRAPSASSPAASASACSWRARSSRTRGSCCSTSRSAGVDAASADVLAGADRPRSPPRAAACSSRRTTSTRRAASTACSASTAARSRSARPTVLTRPVLEATYGGAIVAVDGGADGQPARGILPAPPPRPRATAMTDAWSWLSEPWGEAFMQHAFAEVALVGLVGGWLGCWVLLYGVSYSAESLSHGMFPGLVGASLLGLPLVAGGAGGRGAAAAASRALGGRARHRPRHVGRRRDHVRVRARRAARAHARLAAGHPGAAVRRRARRSRRTTCVGHGADRAAGARARCGCCTTRLLAVGFDRSTARAIGIAPRAGRAGR